MERYVYRPLLPAPNSIRLLRILPGDAGTEIHCEVFDYTIRERQGLALYEALSYVWGDPNDRRRIVVRDVDVCSAFAKPLNYLDVTTNLYTALQHLRDPVLPRVMWIDAVCIDQDNLEERGSQVQFMARIYSYASRVVVWLGQDANESKELLALLEIAAVQPTHEEEDGSKSWIHAPKQYLDEAKLVEGLTAMLDRPWFHRLWVLQEAAAAKHLAIVCGQAEITGTAFSLGLRGLLLQYTTKLGALGSGPPVLGVLSASHQTMTQRSHGLKGQLRHTPVSLDVAPLGELLDSFFLLQATDPRDRVFALLGLNRSMDYASLPPQPDYTKSWPAIFTDLIRYLFGASVQTAIHNSQRCAVITSTGHYIGRVIKVDTPSQSFDITGHHFSGPQGVQIRCRLDWPNSPHWAKVKLGDILWQMDDAPYPTLIRFCQDHFDIVMVSANPQNVELILDSGPYGIPWSRLRNVLQAKGRPLVLIWDWLRSNQDDSLNYVSLFQDDVGRSIDCPSSELRLHTSLTILDDIRHYGDDAGLSSMLESVVESMDSATCQLLRTVYTHWPSYARLKTRIEDMRWKIWSLERVPPERTNVAEHIPAVLAYWNSEGTQPYHIHQIAAIFDIHVQQARSLAPHNSSTASVPSSGAFGVAQSGRKIHDGPPWDDRNLIELILAESNLKPRGSRTISANIIRAHLDQLTYEQDTPNDLVLSIIAVHLGNVPFLSMVPLKANAKESRTWSTLSSSLVKSDDNAQDIYNVLTSAIKTCLDMPYDRSRGTTPTSPTPSEDSCAAMFDLDPDSIPDSNSEYYPESIMSIDSNINLYDYWIAPFIHEHVAILLPVLEDTSLCEIAHACDDDHVIDVLQQLFPSRAYDRTVGLCGPCQDSYLILDGMERWKRAERYEAEESDPDLEESDSNMREEDNSTDDG